MRFKILIFSLLFSTSIFASNKDTTVVFDSHQINNDLDSLLRLWYVQLAYETPQNFVQADSTELINLSDSIIIDRLQKIEKEFVLTYNDRVSAFINMYANKRRRQVASMLDLSTYYFPIFEETLDKYNVPLELKYLPIIESALNQRAVSRAGATGLWQFMYLTGKQYKLEINTYVDERKDPRKSTEAAARFLSDLYKIYGDWQLVIAAYNCGPGNVNKAIRRSGGKRNFWEIYNWLPRETRGYVPAFIAAHYIFEYHNEHQIYKKDLNFISVTDTIMITKKLHLQQVADVLKIDIEKLRDLNPQYSKDIIPAKNKAYQLRLPFDKTAEFITLQDSIYKYKDTIFFNPSRPVITPANYQASKYVAPLPSKDMVAVTYTIKAGDNVGFIADWFDVGLSNLKYWNNIGRRNLIRGGQKLTIYVHKSKAAKYKKIDKMSFAQKQAMIGKTVETEKKSTPAIKDNYKGNYVYYTVRSGDNFWTIARKYPGISNTDIMKLNHISDAGSLKVGQKLKIKRKS